MSDAEQTINPLPSAGESFLTTLRTFLNQEDADRYALMFQDFVVSGGIHGTAAGLVGTPSALIAFAAGFYVTETGSITYTNNVTTFVIANAEITGNLGTYLRVAGTHYLIDATSPIEPALPTGAVRLMTVTTSGGAITAVSDRRNRIARPLNSVGTRTLEDFGGSVGAAGSINYQAFVDAIASLSLSGGGELSISEGAWTFTFTGATAISVPANTWIHGAGRGITTLLWTTNSATQRTIFNVSGNNVRFSDFSMSQTARATQVMLYFTPSANDFVLEDCDFDGVMTNTGAALNNFPYLISFPTGAVSQRGLRIEHCAIHRFDYCFLKTNASLSNQEDIKILSNDFFNNYHEDAAFNSPLGSMDGVLVRGNTFRDGSGSGAALSQLYASCASVSNFSIVGNTFRDTAAEAIHIEEDCFNWTITGNVIDIVGIGITSTDNNIAGPRTVPQYGTIVSNTIRKAGAFQAAGSLGIRLTYDATGTPAVKNVVVADNTITSFEIGMQLGVLFDTGCAVRDNLIEGCAKGIFLAEGSFIIKDNVTFGCTIGIYSDVGSAVHGHTFNNCTTNVDAATRPVMLVNPVVIVPAFNIGAGATLFPILFDTIGASDRVQGNISHFVWVDSATADYSASTDSILWDGVTFFRTALMSIEPGGVVVDTVRSGGTDLCVSVSSVSARSNVRVQSSLTGAIVIAV